MNAEQADTTIDVRGIAPRMRHTLIFKAFQDLAPGRALLLVNDHDPIPLRYHFSTEFSGLFEWVYRERGPDTWQVRICRTAA